MRKTRKIHYWIGIIASVFLFIESVSGIYLYFQEKGRENTFSDRQAFFQQQRSNIQHQRGANSNSSEQNNRSSFSGQQPPFNRGEMNFNRQGNMNSFGMTLRQLHSGIIGLIAGIGMLIMTGTGLVLSVIIARANRKRKTRDA
ncbi:PepSY domain-containing protein [Bacillus sp. FJAT-49736]|uniref:PepSY domain-containing protein n=1 Tax=Bacillus sp. FJAT-49736 TaxID=2833582 RepID=UPI001BC99F4A|nr:PepSY domain-containing protein [Bacillus sp. FJAT-49736]MBS4173999.1 PepSY domain-containing protein [Bacillus sp. FJAT-49736]